jgi:hypothetical protein
VNLVVTQHRRYPHPPGVMWQVFARPDLAAGLDARVALISQQGVPGDVGSTYEVELRLSPRRTMRQVVEVTESDPPHLLRATTHMHSKAVGDQLTELTAIEGGTLVVWTITGTSPRILRWLTRPLVNRELSRWLEAADGAAELLA